MPRARDVYDNPDRYWDLITAPDDGDCEGQHFDRKEAGRLGSGGALTSAQFSSLREHIKETVSAFSNSNRDGGLLVLGVTKSGQVKGINHIPDRQRANLTHIDGLLVHHAAECRFYECKDDGGGDNQICLVFAPYAEHAICEEAGNSPKAWERQGCSNVVVTAARRDQIRHAKRIVDFERTRCCEFGREDLAKDVVDEFRAARQLGSKAEIDDIALLYNAGALLREGDGYAFTNAGALFFASNPQRVMPWAALRLLRYEVDSEDRETRSLPTFDRQFSGPLTQQIRQVRSFMQEAGFFRVYQERNPDGGFREDPEYPYVAIDEAIVNAIAHRDYGVRRPIECEAYRDAFVVVNPGPVMQRDRDVPEHFTLDSTTLDSAPRNPMLMDWLRSMKDERGKAFVHAISEGTRAMQSATAQAQLPPPCYDLTVAQTSVSLFNNAVEREQRRKVLAAHKATEYANLFQVTCVSLSGQNPRPSDDDLRHELLSALENALRMRGWFIHSTRFGRVVAHPKGAKIPLPDDVYRVVRLFPAYSLQFRHYWGRLYLCVDYSLVVRNALSVQALLDVVDPTTINQRSALAYSDGWRRARVLCVDREWTQVHVVESNTEEQLQSSKVVPNLGISTIDRVLTGRGLRFDLHRAIKQHGLALQSNASRIRAEKTSCAVEELDREVFPLVVGDTKARLSTEPVCLVRAESRGGGMLVRSIPEPHVEFNHHRETADIRDGITEFGAYSNDARTVELVPICTADLRQSMVSLIERLRVGAYKYRGSERTFSTRLNYSTVVTVPSVDLILPECRRLIEERPEIKGDAALSRLFLVHTPEEGYAADDETSPYYQVKRFLLEQGIPCQMVDTPTLRNPDWKDLNLALNIIAKVGVTPWVLPDAIPDADFFVGLSYTQSGEGGSERLMGYANVFNEFGRWEFYAGNTQAFPYAERSEHFGRLIADTLGKLQLSATPSVHFHYSAKFSRDDRDAILAAARSIRPLGTYTFVWVNTHHTVRLYDSRPETDGSLSRGSYVLASPNQVFLSTTGHNPYRKAAGTPLMLEVNARMERPDGKPQGPPDMRAIAVQVLNLTKLNWASTDSLCAEPITTKYAGDIAYLTSAFLRQSPEFCLHPVLERTPWFL